MTGYLRSVRTARSSRRIHNRLKRHAELMSGLITGGMDKAQASSHAMTMLLQEEKAAKRPRKAKAAPEPELACAHA